MGLVATIRTLQSIPYIIGEKKSLLYIGGCLSATNYKKRTNKVSTFDEDSQTWTS